ncbi:hypothetical protein C8A01DRAFT_42075 [Parachaetomium inaequale]|uniref:Uncharacterized protein n=1 Tax=Parachaetomium inaequale TaxID=2588326 RepID=A0AAN6P6U9_9PEZI|nr:hypothetical protein C8A01DRAFT_42075 [Parachaetomium inaequale]
MRTFALLALSYLSTAVWAGGYQGCLERVWTYQAYLIDGLNAVNDQTLGFKCANANFDKATGDCRVDWERCESKTAPAPKDKGWRVPEDETKPIDAEATAKKCYEEHNKRGRRIYNFPPFSVAKKQAEFNALITKVNDIVNKAYREIRTADNKHLWEDFDTTTDKIVTARAGDHGPYLLKSAGEHERLKGVVTIKKQKLGPNPVANPPADWETLDWTVTEDEAKRNGVADADERLGKFRADFYKAGSIAQEYDQVIESYKRVQESKTTCR